MDQFKKARKLIRESKNISILPSKDNQAEIIPISLALFYTLRKLRKNVNLLIEDLPKKFQFLIPSVSFISHPKDFILSIPKTKAEISQVRYEKGEDNLKLYLTLDKGTITKNDISLNLTHFTPDFLITIGVKNQNYLKEFFPGNPFNFPILNIDSLLNPNSSLTEMVFNFIKSIDNNLFDKDIATCFLTSLVVLSENFQNQNTTPETFETAAFLVKRGALHQQVVNYLYKV